MALLALLQNTARIKESRTAFVQARRTKLPGQDRRAINLHRRRSMIVRMTESGERLETARILNDRDRLAEVMARARESPEVVLEANVRMVLGG